MKTGLSVVLGAALLAATTLGCVESSPEAFPAPPDATPQLIGGALDTIDPATVLVIIQDDIENPTWQGKCTGTVVAPHVVLTAAHCFAEEVIGFEQVYVAVFTGDDIDDPDQGSDVAYFRFEESHAYDQDFNADDPLGDSHDVAVVVTDEAFDATPIAMNRLAPPAVGTSMHLVGYGLSEAGNEDSFGKRQMTDATIAGDDDGHLMFKDSGLCSGDSGGPSLWPRDGSSYVAGIHSFVEHIESCSGKGYDLTVDAEVLAFVDPVIEDADPGFLASQPPQVAEGSGGADAATTSAADVGSSASATTGAGGASSSEGGGDPSDGDDAAGDADDDGCAFARRPATGGIAPLAVVLAAGLLRLRRRFRG